MKVRTTLALAASCFAVSAPTAFAEERSCRGALGKVTVDNLRVPQGATCTLDGTTSRARSRSSAPRR